MSVIHDDYLLSSSAPVTVSGDEKDISFELDQNISNLRGTVSGKVYDTVTVAGKEIEGATVKLFYSQGDPIMHTETGISGSYTFADVPAGEYVLSAVKNGYIMAIDIPIVVTSSLPVIEDIILTKDQKVVQGIIYGVVTDPVLSQPISGADVVLYKEIENVQTKIAATKTTDDGGYVLEDLDVGSYNVLFSKSGYYSSGTIPVSVAFSGNTKQSTQLERDLESASGTISGTIKNSTRLPLAGAFVGLYTATGGLAETLIATTHANINGKYMFGGVDAGQYVVKSKLSELI